MINIKIKITAQLSSEEHKQRHIELHTALDELFADYIENHKEESSFTKIPIRKLIEWSYTQTINPTEIKPNL